jgi:peroxiredoxin
MAEKVSSIKIITISTDSRSRLQKFLKKTFELPVVIPLGIQKYFPHFELPHTVIIDKNGIVKSYNSR